MDIYGQALTDFYHNQSEEILWINNSYGEPEEMPVDVFFRAIDDMSDLEILALQQCKGKILDIGAGAGSHSLALQQINFNVTALEISVPACRIMELRGVKKVISADFFKYNSERYDTLLLMMNGIGLSGTLAGLHSFLLHAKKLLNPGGQILCDSSDISYLYENGLQKPSPYYGEISFQYEYKNTKGEWFNWLYVDKNTLSQYAKAVGFKTEILFEDDHDQFLARLKFS